MRSSKSRFLILFCVPRLTASRTLARRQSAARERERGLSVRPVIGSDNVPSDNAFPSFLLITATTQLNLLDGPENEPPTARDNLIRSIRYEKFQDVWLKCGEAITLRRLCRNYRFLFFFPFLPKEKGRVCYVALFLRRCEGRGRRRGG